MKRLASLLAIVLLIGGCAGVVTTDELQGISYGMTEKEVVEQIGRPIDINRSSGSWGTSAQFVYNKGGMGHDRIYLYFRNHRLESIQY